MEEYNEAYFRAGAWSCAEENGKIWMALKNRNGICEIDKKTLCGKIIKNFESESLADIDLYSHIEKVRNTLIFTPGMAEKIAVYNLDLQSLSYISLKILDRCYKENPFDIKFWNTLQYQSDIYMFGYSYPAIIKIDTNSLDVVYITDWVEEIEANIQVGNNDGYFTTGHVIYDNYALIPVGCMNAILELDFITGRTQIKRLNIPIKGLSGLSSEDGENIWIVGRSGNAVKSDKYLWMVERDNSPNRVFCWNRKSGAIKDFPLTDVDENKYNPFHAPLCINSKVFLIPMEASYIYEIDTYTGELKKNNILGKILDDSKGQLDPWRTVVASELRGEWLSFLTCKDYKWHEYNVNTGELRSNFYYVKENLKDTVQYFESIYAKDDLLTESKLPFSYFIDKILRTDNALKNDNHSNLVGEKIFNQISGILLH